MQIRERKLPWWLIIVTGLISIAAGIFVLADSINGLKVLVFLVGLGTLAFGVYNIIIAFKNYSQRNVFLPFLVHGLIDILLLLLIIIIKDSPLLLGIIVSCWLMVFGVFEAIAGRRDENQKLSRLGAILVIIGFIVLIIPLIFSIDYLILIGIVGIVFGVLRVVLGVLIKSNEQKATSKVV